jgi:hypothetical protein
MRHLMTLVPTPLVRRCGLFRPGLAVLAHKRATFLRLRDTQRIDDTVLLRLRARLYNEERTYGRADRGVLSSAGGRRPSSMVWIIGSR